MHKSSFLFVFFIFAVSFVPLLPLLKPGLFDTHDGDLQIARMYTYYRALSDGQFPVRWASDLNYGFGHPVLIFMYPLPSYVGALLYMFSISLIDTFKIITGVSFVSANIAMFLFLKELVKNSVGATIGALLYGFAPYRFLDMYVRGDLGEQLAFVFVPLTFYFLLRIFKKTNSSSVILGSVCFALVILSHNGYALLFTPILIGFAIALFVLKRTKAIAFGILLMFILGLCLSAFFWIPAVGESKYTHAKALIGMMYRNEFPDLTKLIYSPWGFGSKVKSPGGLSPQIGAVQWISVILFGIVAVVSRKKKDYVFLLSLYFFLIFFGALLFMLPVSSFLWETIPTLPYLQFPWRIVGVSVFCASVVSAFLISYGYSIKNLHFLSTKTGAVIIGICIVASTIIFWKTGTSNRRTDEFYKAYKGDTTWHGQTNAIWAEENKTAMAKKQIEIISGQGFLPHFKKQSTRHILSINAKTDIRILDNTVYFPGWQALVDGKKMTIEFQDQHHRGLITFSVPKGKHEVIVRFVESPIRLFSDIISFSTVLILGSLLFLKLHIRTNAV